MFRIEEKIITQIDKNKNILFFIIITFLGALIRYEGRNFVSMDMEIYLWPWYEDIRSNGGFAALKTQVGSYNLLYQTYIALMTYLDANVTYMYKMLSIAFDFLMSLTAAFFVSELTKKEKFGFTFLCVYAIMLFFPTNVFNSAYWGQCDSIYTYFVILTLLYMYKEKYVWAFVFLGIAFAFKVQAILVLPFIICYYFYKRRFSILMFGISIAVFWLSGIVAYCNGRDIWAPFQIYADQTEWFPAMYLNVASILALVGNDYDNLKTFAVLITLIFCGMGLYVTLHKIKRIDSAEQFMNTVVWFVWTCLLFLPAMHERYTYPLDILLIIVSFIDKKYIKYTAVSAVMSLITNAGYLFEYPGLDRFCILLYVAAWLHYTYTIIEQDYYNKNCIDIVPKV